MEMWMAIALLSPVGMLVLWIVSGNQEAENQAYIQVEEKPAAQDEQRRQAA